MKLTKEMIKRWREYHGLTQEELGNLLYLSGAQISRMENGDRRITERTERDILKACKGIEKHTNAK